MKKILLQILLFINLIGFSQNDEFFCDNITTNQNRSLLSSYNCSTSESFIRNKLATRGSDFSNETPIVINVQFHAVPPYQNEVSECNVLRNVANMNTFYNPFKIYFKYIGYDTNPVQLTDVDKLHITISYGGNVFLGDSFGKRVTLNYTNFLASSPSPVLLHEVGHAISLRHPWFGSTSHEGIELSFVSLPVPYDCNGSNITELKRPDFTNYSPSFDRRTEHVTRDQTNPNYNAYTSGDCVPDTSAQTVYLTKCRTYGSNGGHTTYIQNNGVVDIVGEPYVINSSTADNIMGYNAKLFFTTGQGWRMRSFLETTIQLNALLGTAVNSDGLKALYKPYYSDIVIDMDNNHIASIDDDPNNPGYAIVCRPQYISHKFQKGYEYHIYKVTNGYYTNGQIVDPNDASLQEIIPIDSNCDAEIKGTKLAVKIPGFSDDIIMFEDIACIRGNYCSSEQITSTTIITTPVLGDEHSTIIELNTPESANPDLEKNLEHQKYHTIKKTTSSGAKNNKTIYKE